MQEINLKKRLKNLKANNKTIVGVEIVAKLNLNNNLHTLWRLPHHKIFSHHSAMHNIITSNKMTMIATNILLMREGRIPIRKIWWKFNKVQSTIQKRNQLFLHQWPICGKSTNSRTLKLILTIKFTKEHRPLLLQKKWTKK